MKTLLFQRVRNAQDFSRFVRKAAIKGDHFIIKPNWYSPHPGNFTDAQTLDLLLESLKGKKTIIESYTGARNDGSKNITPENTHQNRDWIRDQEQWFLKETGVAEVLAKHNAEYLNITEEVWQGRTVDAEIIRKAVEDKYPPLKHKEFYSYFPQKLSDLREKTLISFARIKVGLGGDLGFSLSMKNLFGLIPDPSREKYHGDLPQSIIDINKIYRALFNVVGICEGIFQLVTYCPEGQIQTPWGKYNIIRDQGVVVFGEELVELDAFTARLFELDVTGRTLLKLGAQTFGSWDQKVIESAPSLLMEINKERCQTYDEELLAKINIRNSKF